MTKHAFRNGGPRKSGAANDKTVSSPTAVGTTVAGPAHPASPANEMAVHGAEQQSLAAAVPANAAKAAEYGVDNALKPVKG